MTSEGANHPGWQSPHSVSRVTVPAWAFSLPRGLQREWGWHGLEPQEVEKVPGGQDLHSVPCPGSKLGSSPGGHCQGVVDVDAAGGQGSTTRRQDRAQCGGGRSFILSFILRPRSPQPRTDGGGRLSRWVPAGSCCPPSTASRAAPDGEFARCCQAGRAPGKPGVYSPPPPPPPQARVEVGVPYLGPASQGNTDWTG